MSIRSHKKFLKLALGSISLMGLTDLKATEWLGVNSQLQEPRNWSNGVPDIYSIAEFSSVGSANRDLGTFYELSALGIVYDSDAPAYVIASFDGDINIGLLGVVNNSANTQVIGIASAVDTTIYFAGGSSGLNMSYPISDQLPGGVVFLTGTTGNGTFLLSNNATLTNVNGDSTIGSLGAGTSPTTAIILTDGSLTTGSLNGDDYFYGPISGAGSLILSTTSSNGMLSLGNINTYTGGTEINAQDFGGMVLLAADLPNYPGGYLPPTGTLAVNSGALYLNESPGFQTTGSLSGTGEAYIALGNAYGLTVNQTTNETYAGTFTGNTGSTFIYGTPGSTTAIATLQLTGDSDDYIGNVVVNSGNLQVNNHLGGSSFTVNSGGTLSGTGTFGTLNQTATVASGGTLSPGNSVGILRNAGNQVFAPGSIFRLEENGYTTEFGIPSIDLLIVDGTATVDNAIVDLVTTNGYINFNTKQRFLTAAGGLTVESNGFALNTSSLAGFNPNAFKGFHSYDANNYYIFTQTQFGSLTGGNSLAKQLDAIQNPSTPQNFFLNELAKLSLPDLFDALENMTGAQYVTTSFLAGVANRQFIRRLYDPLRALLRNEPCDDRCCQFIGFDTWAVVGGGQRRVNGKFGANLSEWDITVGLQKTFLNAITLGLAGSYEHNSINYHSSNGLGNGYSLFGGLYGLYRPACYYLLADIAYGYTQQKVSRHLVLSDVTNKFVGRPNISQLTFYAEGGFDVNLSSFLIKPFVGIAVAGFHRNRFSEKEVVVSDLGLNLHKKDFTAGASSLGLHVTEHCMSIINIGLDLAWLYRFTHDAHYSANFESFGTDFPVYGQRIGRSSVEGAITFTREITNTLRAYVKGSGEVWNRAYSYHILAGVQMDW